MVRVVVHLADIHIRTFRLHEEYKEVFKTLLADVKELVKDYQREEVRIVIAGDLVHQKIVISNEQLILGTWLLRSLEKIAPLILIAGNHDLLENNKDRMDSITPMVQFLVTTSTMSTTCLQVLNLMSIHATGGRLVSTAFSTLWSNSQLEPVTSFT